MQVDSSVDNKIYILRRTIQVDSSDDKKSCILSRIIQVDSSDDSKSCILSRTIQVESSDDKYLHPQFNQLQLNPQLDKEDCILSSFNRS